MSVNYSYYDLVAGCSATVIKRTCFTHNFACFKMGIILLLNRVLMANFYLI